MTLTLDVEGEVLNEDAWHNIEDDKIDGDLPKVLVDRLKHQLNGRILKRIDRAYAPLVSTSVKFSLISKIVDGYNLLDHLQVLASCKIHGGRKFPT